MYLIQVKTRSKHSFFYSMTFRIVVRICADFTPNCSFSVTSTKLSGMIDFNVAVNIRYGAQGKIGANGQNFCVSLFF